MKKSRTNVQLHEILAWRMWKIRRTPVKVQLSLKLAFWIPIGPELDIESVPLERISIFALPWMNSASPSCRCPHLLSIKRVLLRLFHLDRHSRQTEGAYRIRIICPHLNERLGLITSKSEPCQTRHFISAPQGLHFNAMVVEGRSVS